LLLSCSPWTCARCTPEAARDCRWQWTVHPSCCGTPATPTGRSGLPALGGAKCRAPGLGPAQVSRPLVDRLDPRLCDEKAPHAQRCAAWGGSALYIQVAEKPIPSDGKTPRQARCAWRRGLRLPYSGPYKFRSCCAVGLNPDCAMMRRSAALRPCHACAGNSSWVK